MEPGIAFATCCSHEVKIMYDTVTEVRQNVVVMEQESGKDECGKSILLLSLNVSTRIQT